MVVKIDTSPGVHGKGDEGGAVLGGVVDVVDGEMLSAALGVAREAPL